MAAAPEKPHYVGHRKRLRERFLKSGADSLADYELLELLLFMARPRADVKPLAKALMARFGSFAEVISADTERLAETAGAGESVIVVLKSVQAAALKLMREDVMDKPILGSWEKVLAYCRATMGYGKTEQFRILFLNNKNILIADEEQAKGTVDHVPVYPREVVKRALELNASAVILVHNHPSGDPTPSQADIDMTRQIELAARAVGVVVHDHVIVGKERDASFRALALL